MYEGASCVGWCQFGFPVELPRIKHRKEYEQGLIPPPDWRITCFYIGKGHRHKGVAVAGLAGALAEIEHLGGGVVESDPEDADLEDVAGRSVSSSFLDNGTLGMFESQGCERTRRLGKGHWVVTKSIPGHRAT